MGVPIEHQDDDAEDAHNPLERALLIGKRLKDRPMIIVVTLVAITLLLAVVLWALMLGLFKEADPGGDHGDVLDIRKMEEFEHTLDSTMYLQEGEPVLFPYDFYHTLELPGEFGEIVVCFIDRVSVTIQWYDEPGEQRGPVSWENQPDTVRAAVYDTDHGILEVSQEGTNPQGGEGSIALTWHGAGEYLEQSWRRVDEHHWEGVDGELYIDVTGGEVHWDRYLDGDLLLVEAGDHTHPMLPVGFTDTGNEVMVSVTLGGRCVSLPPGSYEEP